MSKKTTKKKSNRMYDLTVSWRSRPEIRIAECSLKTPPHSTSYAYFSCPPSTAGSKSLSRRCNKIKTTPTPPTIGNNNKNDLPKVGQTRTTPALHRKSKSKSNSKLSFGYGLLHLDSESRKLTESQKQADHQHGTETSDPTQLRLQNQTQPTIQPKIRSGDTTLSTTPTSLSQKQLCARSNNNSTITSNRSSGKKKPRTSLHCKMLVPLPMLGATSFVTLLTVICIETVLLSTMSSCAKTFYMHWNTSNSIFRIDNTDHIIDVNKGNLAFEFDQVHIICPVYEPGAFENETEKYIIYNVSKVEYETCRITNADPRVIAICDKPQKLMFFTITFRPFTPQPGGLEFLPGNDYYFISTSSKDDLYRRIGGRCSTNNMKVVFKVCCAAEEKNKTIQPDTTLAENSGGGSLVNVVDNAGGVNLDLNINMNHNVDHSIGINAVNTGLIPVGGGGGLSNNRAAVGNGVQLNPSSINTNFDQYNRIPIQPSIIGNNLGGNGGGSIMLSSGHGSINMLPPGRNAGGGVHMTYPGHHHIQTGIRINNVPTQPQSNLHPHHKGNTNVNNNNNGKDILTNIQTNQEVGNGIGTGRAIPDYYLPPIVDTNNSNIVQSTINWPLPAWRPYDNSTTPTNTKLLTTNSSHIYINRTHTNIYYKPQDFANTKNLKNDHGFDKHPNEVVKNEELTYNSGTASSHINANIWTWIWIYLMSSTVLSSNGSYSMALISIILVTIFHYLLGIKTTTSLNLRSEHNFVVASR